jgi:hypothetical protein
MVSSQGSLFRMGLEMEPLRPSQPWTTSMSLLPSPSQPPCLFSYADSWRLWL